MSFKKRLIAVAAIIVMAAAVLYGVSAKPEDVPEAVSDSLSWYERKETLYFWYSDEAMTNFINSVAVDFGEQNDVRVIPVLASESEYLEAINNASLHTTQVPDAYIVSHDMLEKAYLAGLATRIEDGEGVCDAEHFPQAALHAVTYQEKEVAYPLYFETSALIYNKNYLELWSQQAALREFVGVGSDETTADIDASDVDPVALAEKTAIYYNIAVPTTVDFVLTIANTFTAPEGVEGVMKWDVSDIFYNYWFVGKYINVGGVTGDDPYTLSLNSNEIKECLDVYKNLNQFFSIESDTVTYESVVDDFAKGKTVFTIATTDVIQKLEDAKAAGDVNFEYGIANLPDTNYALESRTLSVTNAVAINGYSENKELANQFAAYLADTCAGKLYESTGKISANLKANTDDEKLMIFKEIYSESVPMTKLMEAANFWMHLEALFAKVWNGADVTEELQIFADQIQMQIDANK